MGPKHVHKSKNITKKVIKSIKKERLVAKSEELKALAKSQSTSEVQEIAQVSKDAIARSLSTLSIAVPGSILENAQTLELRSYLAGQIARAASIYRVDEIVVFDDLGEVGAHEKCDEMFDGVPSRKCCIQLARILQFLECPQYLRKHLFPLHSDFSLVGLISPLVAPHHLRQDEDCRFREGVILNRPSPKGSYVNIGLRKECYIKRELKPGIRVTVELDDQGSLNKKNLLGKVTSINHAKLHVGYWGYRVRVANTISEIFSRSPYADGYDLMIGTSDKGLSVDDFTPVEYNHALLVFGGLYGLEQALECDAEQLATDPAELFDHYINTCPDQGSRTIRTEEAVLITLAELRRKLRPHDSPPSSSLGSMFSNRQPPSDLSSGQEKQ